ncbi:MAG TPA: hypothetical protein VL974_00075 [Magnetospirillum sp.]|jgi:hypothetical protein|nr:hypothetical protein [Magnetospirillum sp.]
MAVGRIASFLSSLSPAADAAAQSDSVPEELERRAEAASQQSQLTDDQRRSNASDIAVQLQTMVSAVRMLNENAVQQGAAVAISAAGTELHNAVTGLGHLLAAVDAHALATGAAAPVREASDVIDGVEAGVSSAQASAEQIMRNLPAAQAQRAQEASNQFQAQMRGAIRQVREALSDLNVRA